MKGLSSRRYGVSFLALAFASVVVLAGPACKRTGETAAPPAPPVAKRVPHALTEHGETRIDDYFWLNERDNPEVLAYLKAEDDYRRQMLKHTEPLQKSLFEEMVGRLKQDDSSAPYLLNGYYYFRRYETAKEYALYVRKKGSLAAREEVMLDGPRMAEGQSFFSLTGLSPSPDNRLLAYGVDTLSRRLYALRFKDLTSGETLPDAIPNTEGGAVWAADSRSVFYIVKDTTTLRPFLVRRHILGTDPREDGNVYEEKDVTFEVGLYPSKSREFIMIASESTLTDEVLFIPAARPDEAPRVFQPRVTDMKYAADHAGSAFVILTNWQARSFRLMEASIAATGRDAWREIVPHREDVLLEDFDAFNDYLALQERRDGLTRLRVLDRLGREGRSPQFAEADYVVALENNREAATSRLRYTYTSLATPDSVFEFDMASGDNTLIKRDEVLGGFDATNYWTERLFATAPDGVRVPISVVYRIGFDQDGRSPLLLYGYGSYGASTDAEFNASLLSLLDRGFAFAIAHIRGGQEMGRWWYEDGKLLKKKNTFTDFITCAEFLIAQKYTSPDRLFARGASAGGLLMGAVVNLRPDLFRGVIAGVPYVDVITTMMDASIPLTTSEYDEWGNPADKVYYDYMLSYSPYDQVARQDYPALFVTTGLNDSQVQYFEPAKWVAKLRALKTDRNPLVLYVNFSGGHGGASGRFERLRETAILYAFVLDLAGVKD
ncbi:MAG: S9 family peptidase [Candidatus Aminicenantes bacterium]|nr:S9 family peptidase [Candidatus Aminicenantes bacterium]